MTERPGYDSYVDMSESRGPLSQAFASQVLATTAPWLARSADQLDVLDLGSGYGGTSIALSRQCRSVLGVEPARFLYEKAVEALLEQPHGDVSFRNGGVEELVERDAFDLVVLDNVYEHLPNQLQALSLIHEALRPGGVLYLLTPNKLWPIEAHYRLPGLAWLPLSLADRYLRFSGRGTSYEDASYAPTYWGLRSALRQHDWEFEFVLPGDRAESYGPHPNHRATPIQLRRRQRSRG